MLVAHLCILLLSIYAIVKSSDSLVDIASGLGGKARLNDYFIGSFLVGIGTSLPELFTSIAATNSGSPQLVAPTVFGTVIANIGAGFGLGVLALFFFVRGDGRFRLFTKSHALSDGYLNFDSINASPVIFATGSVVLTFLLCLDGVFDRFDAGLFLLLYAGFIFTEFYRSRFQKPAADPHPTRTEIILSRVEKDRHQRAAIWRISPSLAAIVVVFAVPGVWQELGTIASGNFVFYFFVVGLFLILGFQFWNYRPELTRTGGPEKTNVENLPAWAGILLLGSVILLLYFSGVIVVGSLVKIADDLQINSGALAASALAIGTSLPDIVVALNVVRRGRHKLLVGHIFQSNIFDAFLIMGVCGLIVPLPEVATGSSNISIIAATLLTFPLLWTLRSKKLTLLGGLGLFLGFLFFVWRLYW